MPVNKNQHTTSDTELPPSLPPDLMLRRADGRAAASDQAILNQELAMSDLVQSLFEDFSLTRRKAPLAQASLSAGLIGAVRKQPTSLKERTSILFYSI
jgi:hypothetical protein